MSDAVEDEGLRVVVEFHPNDDNAAEALKRQFADDDLFEATEARFVACMHSSEFIDRSAGLGEGFFYVNLYNAKIDSNVVTSKRGLILIHNTYLPSFAYNLLLCWMLCAGGERFDLGRLLRHHFKKFFGEQLLRSNPNGIFSRAVYLETLLHDQVCMVPVFEAKSRQPDLDRRATLASQLMSSAVSFHELGHY